MKRMSYSIRVTATELVAHHSDDFILEHLERKVQAEGLDPFTGVVDKHIDPNTGEYTFTWTESIQSIPSNHSKTYIIAGNQSQASDWLLNDMMRTANDPSSYVIVSSVNNLRGIKNPHGIFIGDWCKREDIFDILQVIRISSDNQDKIDKVTAVLKQYLMDNL